MSKTIGIKSYSPGTRRSRWVNDPARVYEPAQAPEVLDEVYTWIKNWDPNFIYDTEWIYTENKIKEILNER